MTMFLKTLVAFLSLSVAPVTNAVDSSVRGSVSEASLDRELTVSGCKYFDTSKTYKLINKSSHLAMTIAGTQNYASVVQKSLGSGSSFRWTLTPAKHPWPTNSYMLINAASHKALNLGHVSVDDGAPFILWTASAPNGGAGNDKLCIREYGHGYYYITVLHSNKVVSVKNSHPGSAIVQSTYHPGNDRQLWEIQQVFSPVPAPIPAPIPAPYPAPVAAPVKAPALVEPRCHIFPGYIQLTDCGIGGSYGCYNNNYALFDHTWVFEVCLDNGRCGSAPFSKHWLLNNSIKEPVINLKDMGLTIYSLETGHARFVDKFGRSSAWVRCNNYTPIGIDLNKSGAVERISGDFDIDIDGDGTVEHLVQWFAPEEGILIDVSIPIVDGHITGKHLFGDEGRHYLNGYKKLEALEDHNKDGIVSGEEAGNLKIWVDANSNARLDEGELHSMEDYGIEGFFTEEIGAIGSLAATSDGPEASNPKSYALLKDGSLMLTEDLIFS